MTRSYNVTKEEFINELHRFYNKHGRTPRHAEFKGEWIGYQWARKLFGSWNNAIKAAGLPTTQDMPYSYTKNELLAQLKDYYSKYGRSPTQRDMPKKDMQGIKHFTTILEVLKTLLKKQVYSN